MVGQTMVVKRTLLLLMVMSVMLAMSVAPAFARSDGYGCVSGVAQTYGAKHQAPDALRAFCYVPVGDPA